MARRGRAGRGHRSHHHHHHRTGFGTTHRFTARTTGTRSRGSGSNDCGDCDDCSGKGVRNAGALLTFIGVVLFFGLWFGIGKDAYDQWSTVPCEYVSSSPESGKCTDLDLQVVFETVRLDNSEIWRTIVPRPEDPIAPCSAYRATPPKCWKFDNTDTLSAQDFFCVNDEEPNLTNASGRSRKLAGILPWAVILYVGLTFLLVHFTFYGTRGNGSRGTLSFVGFIAGAALNLGLLLGYSVPYGFNNVHEADDCIILADTSVFFGVCFVSVQASMGGFGYKLLKPWTDIYPPLNGDPCDSPSLLTPTRSTCYYTFTDFKKSFDLFFSSRELRCDGSFGSIITDSGGLSTTSVKDWTRDFWMQEDPPGLSESGSAGPVAIWVVFGLCVGGFMWIWLPYYFFVRRCCPARFPTTVPSTPTASTPTSSSANPSSPTSPSLRPDTTAILVASGNSFGMVNPVVGGFSEQELAALGTSRSSGASAPNAGVPPSAPPKADPSVELLALLDSSPKQPDLTASRVQSVFEAVADKLDVEGDSGLTHTNVLGCLEPFKAWAREVHDARPDVWTVAVKGLYARILVHCVSV